MSILHSFLSYSLLAKYYCRFNDNFVWWKIHSFFVLKGAGNEILTYKILTDHCIKY